MTMQKSCNLSQSQRSQQQYVRPDSPPPSTVKKSPLAMLVETCSSIGQELSKSSASSGAKPALSSAYDSRKSRLSTSPSSEATKAHSPLHNSQNKAALTKPSANMFRQSQMRNQPSNLTAAALASQYQAMYQQILYQAELEYFQRAKDTSSGAPAINSATLQEHRQLAGSKSKSPCNICMMSVGYTGGPCIHDAIGNGNSLGHMLTMLNPSSSAAAMLAYSNRLAGLNQQDETPDPLHRHSVSPLPSNKRLKPSNLSPSSAHSYGSRRTSANSCTSLGSPKNSDVSDQPMDLQVPKSKSPPSSLRLIECHWVGAEGYCGKRFRSQDDLMSHLKIHVMACPSIVVPSDDGQPSSPKKRVDSASPTSSHRRKSPSSVLSSMSSILDKRHRDRFHPYHMPAHLLLAPQ
ncbi:hypothetical protein EB796_021425 [Bugula neritina]|uniref:C2H2-type domain-containing protein n=1 Tax=Bugula neritina TaxID=10212 RepID=A0A7J7J2C9_BUGNE|nr:hypothetical protein EB796_021425 [Bugula neritina]